MIRCAGRARRKPGKLRAGITGFANPGGANADWSLQNRDESA
jgi:hypothetical protein